MGKANRIRQDKSETNYSAALTTKKKKQMPLWAVTLIAAVVAVAILLAAGYSIVSSTGVNVRMRTVMKSDHYRVDGAMMEYFVANEYSQFQQQYESYMSYFSLDTSKKLSEQPYKFGDEEAAGYEAMFLGEFEGTWLEYFQKAAADEVKQMLVYCESAKADGIELSKEEKEAIDGEIDTLNLYASAYGYDLGGYLSQIYGSGVNKSTVKKCMELSTLASKAVTEIQNAEKDKITDDDVTAEYGKNAKDYDQVGYHYYNLTVNYDTVATEICGADATDEDKKAKADEILAAYKEKIAEAKTTLEGLAGKTTADDFDDALIELLVKKCLAEQIKAAGTFSEDETANTSIVAALEGFEADMIAMVKANEGYVSPFTVNTTEGEEPVTTYTWDTLVLNEGEGEKTDSCLSNAFNNIVSAKTGSVRDGATFAEEDEFSEWAFADGRAVGETKTVYTGDGKDGEVTAKDTGYFYGYVYILTSTRAKDTAKTANVHYATFSDKEKADEFAAQLTGTVTKDSFDAALSGDQLACSDFENYYAGASTGLGTLDTWLESAAVGDVSEVLTVTSNENTVYLVAFFESEGVEKWQVTVKTAILNEKLTDVMAALTEKYTVKTREKALAKAGKNR